MAMTTNSKRKSAAAELKSLLEEDGDRLRTMIQGLLQETLDQEMTEALAAGCSERTAERIGYRAGHYPRSLVTRVGNSNCASPATGTGASPPNCSSATSVRSRRWSALWPRCTSKASRPAR